MHLYVYVYKYIYVYPHMHMFDLFLHSLVLVLCKLLKATVFIVPFYCSFKLQIKNVKFYVYNLIFFILLLQSLFSSLLCYSIFTP